MLRDEKGIILPGAPNALAARIIADLGFRAVYLTGAGLTNMHLGLPDLGFMDLSQVADHVMAIRCVIDLPLIVDIDTGFGNAINVTHTVRILEQAGASAIQIEDQRAPKRCGHFDGKELKLPEEIRTSANHESYFTVFLGSSLDEVEREFIRRTTAFADGNKARASEMLGVPCRTLYGKLERYDARHKSMADLTGTDTAQRAMIA
jgi:hypothetical protein